MMIKRALLLLPLLLSACSWHMANLANLQSHGKDIYFKTNKIRSVFVKTLQQDFRLAKITFAKKSAHQKYIFTIDSEELQQMPISFSANSQMRHYAMRFIVRYSLTNTRHKNKPSKSIAQATREYYYNPHTLLGSEHQRQVILQELHQEVARQVAFGLNRLVKTNT